MKNKRTKRLITALTLMCGFAVCAAGCGNSGKQSDGAVKPEDGTFYSLQEAYRNGWLSDGDLSKIVLYNNNDTVYPEELSASLQSEIKEAAAEVSSEEINGAMQIEADDINIAKYYGTYNEFAIVSVSCTKFKYKDRYKAHDVEIGGVTFHYANDGYVREMAAWKI